MRNPRITSRFTKSRFHPVLKRYRAHLGVDFGARPGTPILSTGDGRVSFAGYSRGYGKTIKIRHSIGLTSLYAHQKSFKSGIKSGSKVKQGQIIGYVGSPAFRPPLHFGMYRGALSTRSRHEEKRKGSAERGQSLQGDPQQNGPEFKAALTKNRAQTPLRFSRNLLRRHRDAQTKTVLARFSDDTEITRLPCEKSDYVRPKRLRTARTGFS